MWILGHTRVRVGQRELLMRLPISRWCDVFGKDITVTKETREQYMCWVGVEGTLRQYDGEDRSFEICNVGTAEGNKAPDIMGGRWWPEEVLEEC